MIYISNGVAVLLVWDSGRFCGFLTQLSDEVNFE